MFLGAVELCNVCFCYYECEL